MAQELWRPVVGYAEYYEVSSTGRVRSLDRVDALGRLRKGCELSQETNKDGHKRVSLAVAGKKRTTFVHQMVLAAFVGVRPENMEACHNDGDPANNDLTNLRWDSKSANALDKVRHGRHPNLLKTHCPHDHEYTDRNTYISPKGSRICRACRNQRKAN